MPPFTYLSIAAVLSLQLLNRVLAQGDEAAATGGQKNNPRKEWTQWQPKVTYELDALPIQYMGSNRIPGGGDPQYGWNQCANNTWNQQSKCQTAWINSIVDWCIWGPPEGGDIASTERIAVAYCTTGKHGTRVIPDGTITGAHFLKTPSYVQVSGIGDFTSIGITNGDSGGELDYAGADDLGNPVGGVIFTTAIPGTHGKPTQVQYWTNFMAYNQFCLRACWGKDGAAHCEHRLDTMGCNFNMPSLTGYDPGFESCEGDDAPFVGVYGPSTFHQGDAVTPEAHSPAPSSNCIATASLSNGLISAPKNQSTTPTNNTVPAPTQPPNHGAGVHKAAPTFGAGSGSNNNGSSTSSSSDAVEVMYPLGTILLFTALAFIGLLTV